MVRQIFNTRIPVWIFVLALGGVFLLWYGAYRLSPVIGLGMFVPKPPTFTAPTFEYGSNPAFSHPEYFAEVKKNLIAAHTDFIEADLSAMKLSVYRNGTSVLSVPIKTKGREGSWWETPAGLYKIETKEENHFSSIGHVYQPWSLAFQGNFFIHGWPYYRDGSQVSTTFSGGCIRLETEDAKAVYAYASLGMPVLVYTKDFVSDSFSYEDLGPKLTAPRYFVADLKSNTVFLSKGQNEEVPIASITKLMTALTAAEYINLDKEITIVPKDLVTTSVPRLKEGQSISVFQLLFPLLMESSNESAWAIARTFDRVSAPGGFIVRMNEKARAIGMPHTSFVDPAGSGTGNVSTAEDLFMFLKYILNNRSFIFTVSSGSLVKSAYGTTMYTDLKNFNLIPEEKSFVGGKIGKTIAAGETYAGVFTRTFRGEERSIAVIMFGSTDIYGDVSRALSFVTARYE